jgi:hypothetical protein
LFTGISIGAGETFTCMIFLFFPPGISGFSIAVDDHRMTKIANLNDELQKILRLLGPDYEKYYS